MNEATLDRTRTEMVNKVLEKTRFDVEVRGPVADNLMAAIHPNNWNSHNSRFLKSADDSRNYIMAVLEMSEDPIEHTAKVVENAVDVYHEKGGQAPENFAAASAAWHITSRFTFQHAVENAIAREIDGETLAPANHKEAVEWEKAGYDIVTDDRTIQVKTGKGTETDDADERINAEIDGRTVRWE